MPSMQDTKTDPHDMLEIAPDVVLVARAAAEFPSLAPDATHRPGERQPNMGAAFTPSPATPQVDTSFRATDTSGGRRHGGWARKALFTFLFTSCSALALAAWQHYGDDAQAMVAGITPQIIPALTSWLPAQKPATIVQPDATDTSSARQSTPPSALAAAPSPTTAAASPVASETTEQVQLLQSMARDVASLTQQIDELKATVAQLKAAQERQEQRQELRQEQISREKPRPEARVSEAKPAEPRPTKLGAPPRPLGTVVQRARPVYPAPQAGYAPAPLPPPGAAPVQVAPPPPPSASSPDDEVLRPPMPVR
jgi:hypothetical protein